MSETQKYQEKTIPFIVPRGTDKETLRLCKIVYLNCLNTQPLSPRSKEITEECISLCEKIYDIVPESQNAVSRERLMILMQKHVQQKLLFRCRPDFTT